MTGSSRIGAEVLRLLRSQRDALLGGDIDTLANLPEKLESAMARLIRTQDAPQQLVEIREMAAANAVLVKAAQAGVAQARTHLSRGAGSMLSTYDQSGQSRHKAPHPGRTLARR